MDPSNDRVGTRDAASRMLGQVRAELEYRPITETIADLPDQMEELQVQISGVSEAIRQRYFPTSAVPIWIGENS